MPFVSSLFRTAGAGTTEIAPNGAPSSLKEREATLSGQPTLPAIEVHDLAKHYGPVRAIDGISFSVAAGEIFGLLGHNGAGKTTTIRILTGRARPTTGSASIAGYDVASDIEHVRPLINLVFEEPNLYERMTGRENLRFFADLYGAPPGRVDDLLERVELTAAAGRKVKTYSSGMKQRLLIARSLINRPAVLFLDEPTRGLDPASAREIRQLIAKQSEQGTTVFLTTHYMEEADQLCDRVAFMNQGKIVALDTPERLKIAYGRPCAKVLMRDGSRTEILLDQPGGNQALAELIAGGQVQTIHSGEASLEEVFLQLTGRRLVQ